MACPTCGHTMTGVGYGVWHCPRCGTLRVEGWGAKEYVPALVLRCRDFQAVKAGEGGNAHAWHRLGIAESIWLPADRPPPP